MDKVSVWNNFLGSIKTKLSDVLYNTWFKDLRLLTINDKDIVIIVPYPVHKNQIINLYMDLIEETFLEITGCQHNIIICLEGEYKEAFSPQQNIINDNLSDESIKEFVENRKTNLNPKYTFDNFIVGDSNRFAFSSCLAVAQNPGKLYNPLFLYGKSGLGKTHLMHAIGNYINENSNLKVLYITTDEFMNEFINITKDSGNKEDNLNYIDIFKNKYRDIDVLMIDDIQFLNNAPKSQVEFTNTFNTLYDNEKQIIVASDTSINDFANLADRLKTRFLGGLTESISPPNIDLKKEIIINKIRVNDYDIDISDDIIDFIANNCGTDVRNLEGSVIRLVAYKATFNIPVITLDIAREVLQEFTTDTTMYRKTSVPKIIDVVSKYYNLDASMIKGKMRKKNVVTARAVAIYLSRIKTSETVERIGLEFGGKDHSTVVYWTNKITEEMKTNSVLENDIKILSEKICE